MPLTLPRIFAALALCAAAPFTTLFAAQPAAAETDLMPWQSDATFIAYSTTAMSITGDISLAGDAAKKTLTTANGTTIALDLVEDRPSGWSLSDNDMWPGAIYALQADPGALVNGNRLCGAEPARFIVFSLIKPDLTSPYVQLAVFSGAAPENIESPGLCATLNYEME